MSKLIPTALERQKIFYHLKKCSSYTAWNRVLGYYKTWADIFEKSVIEAEDKAAVDGKPAELDTQEFVFVLKGYSTCEKCVDLLRQGNKSPFRYDGLLCFTVADRPLSYWGTFVIKYEDGDISFNPDRVPYWVEMCAARRQLGDAWGEIGDPILDTSDTNDAAPFALYQRGRDFGFNGVPWIASDGQVFPPKHFPSHLPEVPAPQE
ncbi:MAG: Imm71 family immunity protein, partial [Rhodoferax sp.]|uniref:Imm71 family immunity protein n=1 Tax=Rhodoferax sp. TaxID=50421 RepID=UPI0032655579